ncbi:tRNA (adenosine(37)-N6)-dimethylallyltransferase MiaA [Arthrospira platensis]|uniref:tRNA (adenosine(37)-N6)-dimethylallyltransferase MiaA n=1 Tax=Limnospira TaxID=2596745 RepID=UPI0001C38CAF|nr:tRNA (adenosine(37)-N6)-dimethylallyltransferase MiaA [Arthrospira platensis]AMW29744.1 tRNA dimethylallyltransferase [Arthrospira platensis YZ]MBD2668255.1 tRNA (adenosine(37)-N6)-dimethylallyltransferase MiaA [Arthrospira platensis FACHB-439]MBD2712968.1 tRNA (adenosine(37)-N6)-dimethylallyltransferase MiaA [Arthrospira platensis FACHB-835]MDT9295925.1 tRNA (adenosine(37)-N6)-dimethylallyltransferase MiaA [Arthrospira platensis PCC 7345]MDT9311609.1 tRNA (adenosine(37)-N6)-dimethylallyltr
MGWTNTRIDDDQLFTPPTGVIVVCGATATGKSGLALTLAKRLETVIISADSRQVYREFDIGTAKPTLAEREQVPHYLIDICDPTETLTLADYQDRANQLISQSDILAGPGKPLLLVGGTGLYIKAIAAGLKIPRVPPHPQLRSQLTALGQPFAYSMLQQVDPIAAQKIHPNDAVRTLRGLEVYYVTGQTISAQQGENPPNYPILQLGLTCQDPLTLTRRICDRTEAMIESGLVAEVQSLGDRYGQDLPLLKTLGYQEISQYLAGDITLAAAKDLTVLHTRQFAKRQNTWFKAIPQIHWFDADSTNLVDQVWETINRFLTHH